jgi:hypothetical protein
MKKRIQILVLLSIVLIGFSCDDEETVAAKKSYVSFGVAEHFDQSGRMSEANTPVSVILSITKNDGTVVFENKSMPLVAFGQGFVTENIEIVPGQYRLTKFMILNSSNQAIYATPVEGSEKAQYVSDPLPILFAITREATSKVIPQVLQVTSNDTPASFGYLSLGYEVVGTPETIKVRTKVEFLVGEILYQNVNAKVKVTGYDGLNAIKYVKEFNYFGPNTNDLTINGTCDRYLFEVQQWGISSQRVIERSSLWEGRADGPSPVTYLLSGSGAAKKVAYSISYFGKLEPTTNILYMEPQSKVVYEYNTAGKIQKRMDYSYSAEKKEYTLLQYAAFTYENGRVARIDQFLANASEAYLHHTYQYDNSGNVLRISEQNANAGVNSEVNFGYDFLTGMVTASYTFSNGNSFIYQFIYTGKNIVSEKTARGGILCSQGGFTYDRNINPLKHLGYVDYSLRNHSVNNRLTEDIQYLGCAFPTLIPNSYTYDYDATGYPTVMTTHYNSGTAPKVGQVRYYYQ